MYILANKYLQELNIQYLLQLKVYMDVVEIIVISLDWAIIKIYIIQKN